MVSVMRYELKPPSLGYSGWTIYVDATAWAHKDKLRVIQMFIDDLKKTIIELKKQEDVSW
jgi:hypothetical protein